MEVYLSILSSTGLKELL